MRALRDPRLLVSLVAGTTQIGRCEDLRPRAEDVRVFEDRRRRDVELRRYLSTEGRRLWTGCTTEKSRRSVMEVISERRDSITGYKDADLRAYQDRFGCTRATPEAVAFIKNHVDSVVEMGAGRGHWQQKLRDSGVNVAAFDNFADCPGTSEVKGADVRFGTPETLRDRPETCLLLVYPPPGDLAVQSLRAGHFRQLIYVGEPRGGANADDAFFDELQHFTLVTTLDLDPFPGGCERLFLLERRHRRRDLLLRTTTAGALLSGILWVFFL